MKTLAIAVVGSKGGTAKSTTAETLAVAAMQAGRTVALVDMDDQRTLSKWWTIRRAKAGGTLRNPALIRDDDAVDAAEARLAEIGADTLIIDTGPADFDAIGNALDAADLAIIPLRPSAHDIMEYDGTVTLCRRRDVRWAFLLVGVGARPSKDDRRVAERLADIGPVLPVMIRHRVSYMHSPLTGQTAAEIDAAAADEARDLWAAVLAMGAADD